MEIEYDQDFDFLIAATIEICNAIDGQPVPEGDISLKYAEGLGRKVIRHIVSVWRLKQAFALQFEGKRFQEEVDLGSIAILTRSALETYLVFHHIFIEPTSSPQHELRFLSWHLAGFIERTKMEEPNEEFKGKWLFEKEEVTRISTKLKSLPEFLRLTDKQQKDILKGDWRMRIPWNQLAINAGFSKDFFAEQYRFLSGYAHAGRLSVMQIQQADTLQKQIDLSRSFVAILMLVIPKFVTDYIKLIPHFENINLRKEHLSLIENWKKVADSLQYWTREKMSKKRSDGEEK
jgi:hypothetical protein